MTLLACKHAGHKGLESLLGVTLRLKRSMTSSLLAAVVMDLRRAYYLAKKLTGLPVWRGHRKKAGLAVATQGGKHNCDSARTITTPKRGLYENVCKSSMRAVAGN